MWWNWLKLSQKWCTQRRILDVRYFESSLYLQKNKAILLYLIQAASNIFYQHWDMSQVCCWDLPVLYSFAAVLVWTQAVMINWKSPSGRIFSLDCINEVWRIFPKYFLFDLPDPQLVFTCLLPIAAPSLFHTAKGLWELSPSSAWMRTPLAVTAKPLHLGKRTAEHHSTRNSIFKTSLSTGSKKNHCSLISEKPGKTSATLGCGMDQSRGPKTIIMSKSTCVTSFSGLYILHKTLLRAHPRPPGDRNSCGEAAGDVAAPASSNIQTAASGCPVAPWMSPWSI